MENQGAGGPIAPGHRRRHRARAQLSTLVQKARDQEQQIAALKANQFDPAKHIPLDEHQKLTTELAALVHQRQAPSTNV